jgi:hypothetical protein
MIFSPFGLSANSTYKADFLILLPISILMVAERFSITFLFTADAGRLVVPLDADVEQHRSQTFYSVKNFRPQGTNGPGILPEVRIRKKAGRWVHVDSEKETDLSEAIGAAIDLFNSQEP